MTTLPLLVVIPAHDFQAAKRVTEAGLVDDELCGFHQRIRGEMGVFCSYRASHRVHDWADIEVEVREWTDEEIEAMNR